MAANELTAIEVVALARCVKEKAEKAALAEIPAASMHNFGFTVYLQGTLTRAGGTAAMTSVIPETVQTVSLRTPDAVSALLRQLKIGPKRLTEALEAIGPKPTAVPELIDVFADVEAKLAKRLPPFPAREVITPAKSGMINVTANVTRC